jgi:hypothetical protein
VDLITIPSDGEREPRQCSDAVELAKHLPLSPRSSFFSSFPPIRKGFFSVPFQFSVMKPWIAKARVLLQIWTSSLGLGPFIIALWIQQDSSPTFRQFIKNKWDNLKKKPLVTYLFFHFIFILKIIIFYISWVNIKFLIHTKKIYTTFISIKYNNHSQISNKAIRVS